MRPVFRALLRVLLVCGLLYASNLAQFLMMSPRDHVGNNQVSNAYLARGVGLFVVPLGIVMGAVPNFLLSGIEK